jgi:hypothetical protein
MPKTKPYLTVYLSAAEHESIAEKAAKAGLSLSAFARRICLAHEVKSLIDLKAVLLVKNSQADLGRLGGLLKQHLATTGGAEDRRRELRGLLRAIEYSQRKLARDCEGITKALRQAQRRSG